MCQNMSRKSKKPVASSPGVISQQLFQRLLSPRTRQFAGVREYFSARDFPAYPPLFELAEAKIFIEKSIAGNFGTRAKARR